MFTLKYLIHFAISTVTQHTIIVLIGSEHTVAECAGIVSAWHCMHYTSIVFRSSEGVWKSNPTQGSEDTEPPND